MQQHAAWSGVADPVEALMSFIRLFIWLQGTSVPEKEARRIFQQMIVAIHYCHRLGIANRDVKVHI